MFIYNKFGQTWPLFNFCCLCLYTQDKWRNLSVSTTQQGSHNKLRISKIKAIAAAAPHSTPNSAPAALVSRNVSSNTVVMGDLSDAILVGKNGPKYAFPLLFCALLEKITFCIDDLFD